MSALLTSTFRNGLAKNILSDIQYGKSRYFHFIGKVSAWDSRISDENTLLIDTPPDQVVLETQDTQDSMTKIRDEIVLAKRVDAGDVSLVVRRVDWAPNVVYAMWDSAADMTTANFYVLNSKFEVWKCIDNNLGGLSTQEPMKPEGITPTDPVQNNVDRYIWKYMYTISTTNRAKFLSNTYMPVKRSLTDRFYNNGSISKVIVTNGGIEYKSLASVTLAASGGSVPAVLVPSVSSFDGSIRKVTIESGGAGYPTNPEITITDPTGLGSGLSNPTATFWAKAEGGIITAVYVVDPGKNYSSTNAATVNVQGDGEGAKFTPVVYDGSVVDIIVEDYGTSYTYANININAEDGKWATAKAVLEESDFISDQSVVEQSAEPGAIHAIKVLTNGSYYTEATVTVTGDGTGCTAHAVISNGEITEIIVDTIGTNYSYASVNIVGDNFTNNISATTASARVVFPPQGGHGHNAEEELNAGTLAVYSNLRGALDSNIQQDFRQYGLIKGLIDANTGVEIISKSVLRGYNVTVFNTTAGLIKDEVLVGSNGKFRVLNFVDTIVNLVSLSDPSIEPVGEMVSETGNRVYQCINKLSSPDFDKYTGNIIYFSDDPAFSFTDEQSVTIKTFIRF